MRIEVLQAVLSRAIVDAEFRECFLANSDQALAAAPLTEDERAYFRDYTPERLYAFVGGLTAHQVVPIRASRRFTVLPADYPAPTDCDIGIWLTPGAVFGNGIHASTQLCLDALEDHLKPGDTVLDVGTGTGILSIAAAKLGAGRVLGVDVLPEAISEASENIRVNGVENLVRVMQGSFGCALHPPDGTPPFRAEIVLANMLPYALLQVIPEGLLDTLLPDALLIVSGMRDWEHPPVEQALRQHGIRSLKKLRRGEWVSFKVQCHAARWFSFRLPRKS